MTITTTTPATAHGTLEQIDSITDAIAAKEATKVDKVAGKGLSTEDFTTDLKNKLEAIDEATAEDINQIVAKFA